ncbi:uncharacterized protein TRIADDRAFT_27148, partial [Trichoplax adhaerens]
RLLFCALGLQISFLLWGILQERVMTIDYDGRKFKNSQFLVFMNRAMSLLVSWSVIKYSRAKDDIAPMYKYSYASFSNIMSSWCQYEALKFVSFPSQVICKASKVIPVMIMGKIVSNRSYPYYEYCTSVLLSIGVSAFLLDAHHLDHHPITKTTLSGTILMLVYISFDSFTSNWQEQLYKKYNMSSVQMMFGVNVFSTALTLVSLLTQGTLPACIAFMMSNSSFAVHVIMLSTCASIGQLFIFYTISCYGALIFTIIMTVRQALSILLSCLIYHHTVTVQGGIGMTIVFLALFLRIYAKKRTARAKTVT